MNFLKIEDEINYFQKLFLLRKEIENFLHEEGFLNIEPSIFEGYDEFIKINSRISKNSTVKILDKNGDILILSPDITTGIVNKFIPKWEEGMKLKLFYHGKTYEYNDIGIKENREMGVELFGEKENSDEKILNTAIKILKNYSDSYLFEIGNSKFLKGILNECDFKKEDYNNILDLLYGKNKQELKEYLSNLPFKKPVSTLSNILDLEGNFDEITDHLKGVYMNDLMKEGIEELYKINSSFKDNEIKEKINDDLSLVSELSYYDGIIIRGYIEGINKEIIKGGRYDYFTEQYGFKIPAIGFSIDLDELIKVVQEVEI